ncbi:MAG TPA: zf-HC2 domain-containing protein [bacterium]|nr:zf-HC2 domain-containing protein [bacterium]HOL34995.1 zf-HC2 domain-containing protein [bacterium]HPP08379.1 zf-HC2 domain-containing protein [bacterium]
MKNCKDFDENIILHIEGKLDSTEKKAIEKHIKVCTRCNSYFEYIKELLLPGNEQTDQNYWDNLTQKILMKIEEYREKQFLRIFRIKKVALSFTIMLIVTTVFLNIFQNQINLIRHFHLFKDYHVIKNLDTLKEIVTLEDGN